MAMQLCPTAATTLQGDLCFPSRACLYSSGLTGSAYRACGEVASALRAMALLQVHQAKALKDLHVGGHNLVVLHELHAVTDLALRVTKVTAQSLGHVMSMLVVQECHLWLCFTDMKQEKEQLLNAPVSQTVLSSTWEHRGRLRRSDTSCAGGNLLLPTWLPPLSLLVTMGAPLRLPSLPRCRSSLPPGSIVEPVAGRTPSPSGPLPNLAVKAGARGPETGNLEIEETARRRCM